MEIFMKLILKSLSAMTLGLSVFSATAAVPSYLVTHNKTNVESNAYIAGVPSIYPTPAQSTRQVAWNLVRIACYGHSTNNKCSAVIKMATNTTNPIVLGTLTMDLTTGDITPKVLSAQGYTITVNPSVLGDTTITKD
jgi:hypothetical protein